MIKVRIKRDSQDRISSVSIKNHGDPIVCSAVSILLLNTINSIEVYTDALFSFESAEEGGDSVLTMTQYDNEGKAELLMKSLVLGYKSIEESYNDEIVVID